MVVQNEPMRIDPLLDPLLMSGGSVNTGSLLAQLIAGYADPIIHAIVRCKLGFPVRDRTIEADSEDLCQEAVAQLLAELHRFKEQPDTHPIADMRGLAAVIAHRVCARWMRQQFPERHALKNRLHYLLTHRKDFAVWRNEKDQLVAGLAAWVNQPVTKERVELSDEPQLASQIRLLSSGRYTELAAILEKVFNHLQHPIALDSLVTELAALLPLEDRPMRWTSQNEDALRVAAQGPDPAWQTEKRIFLQRLWEELCRLPVHQRAALLLNLRDEKGGSCIALFPATGVATFRQLAEVLAIPAEDFAELWNELPLEDAKIAQLLKRTRQQVINARKSARERLARQLKGFI